MQAVKIGWVGQTFAMARCSESNTKGKKTRNRIKKEERKTMVESFINKYREQYNGNFPSLNLTHKEVGGSFYTVREIVRELIQENRVLAPGSSHSPVLNLEYSEDIVQPPLGSLSLDPAHTFLVEINGHDTHETGGGKMDDIHIIKESEKVNYNSVTVSSAWNATGDADISVSCEHDIVTSLHEVSENKEVIFSAHEHSSLSDANLLADNVQVAILECDDLKSSNQLDSVHAISSTATTESTEIDQLDVLALASNSPISNSVCLGEDDYNLAATMKTEVASFIGLEESKSVEISTLDNTEQAEIKKCKDEGFDDGLSNLDVKEDLLSSFDSSPYLTAESVKVQDEVNISNTFCEVEHTSVLKEERTDILVAASPLSLNEINQIHNSSPDVAVKEAGKHTEEPASDVSYNRTSHAAIEQVESLHSSVDDSSKNSIAVSVTSTQVDAHSKSESKFPSNVKGNGDLLLEDVKSGTPRSTIERPHAAEETNPFVSAVKQFIRAFVKFLMSDF